MPAALAVGGIAGAGVGLGTFSVHAVRAQRAMERVTFMHPPLTRSVPVGIAAGVATAVGVTMLARQMGDDRAQHVAAAAALVGGVSTAAGIALGLVVARNRGSVELMTANGFTAATDFWGFAAPMASIGALAGIGAGFVPVHRD